MCGITGFVGFENKNLLKSMCKSLLHRGPDEEGFYFGKNIGLAMRRLAVIDLKSGRQPISNEDETIWAVFNGEIYNYQILRNELLENGHRLKTNSDTETIVHLYEEKGVDFVQKLRGMFAIALWDEKLQRLILVRDRIGEKPLFYFIDNNRLIFGSEIKAILQTGIQTEPDLGAISNYLAAGYVGGEKTFYDKISKLRPGHLLIWEKGSYEIKKYWKNDFSDKTEMSFNNAKLELKKIIRESVKLCLKSDVEVGGFLSGGIDSSMVVALMKENEALVKTFCVGYEGQAAGFNEFNFSRQVSEHIKTEHHELFLGPSANLELLPKIIWHYDEPHGEPTSVLVYLLCEFTRKYVKVALSGTGGDELFFGYPRHVGIRMMGLYSLMPKFFREKLIERLASKWPESTTGNRFAKRAKKFVAGARLSLDDAYFSWVSLFTKEVRAELLSDKLWDNFENRHFEEYLCKFLIGRDDISLYDRAAELDINGYLPEYQLCYMDRMSMAHGLEVRSPLCDYKLVEFVTSLPVNFRLKRFTSKYIFKEIAPDWIPKSISKRKKVGFDSPIGQWLKFELKTFLDNFLAKKEVSKTGILNPEKVQELVGEHLSGKKDYSLQLWSLIALEAWYRMYMEDRVTNGLDYKVSDLRGFARLN